MFTFYSYMKWLLRLRNRHVWHLYRVRATRFTQSNYITSKLTFDWCKAWFRQKTIEWLENGFSESCILSIWRGIFLYASQTTSIYLQKFQICLTKTIKPNIVFPYKQSYRSWYTSKDRQLKLKLCQIYTHIKRLVPMTLGLYLFSFTLAIKLFIRIKRKL